MKNSFYVLGIETSCDDTAASVVNSTREIISNVLSSQNTFHAKYGGIVPEVASRKHLELLPYVVDCAVSRANLSLKDISIVSVTYGPGLVGSLLVGVDFAKALSLSLNIPFVGVNHLEGHLLSPFIENKDLTFPYLGVIISGGHTEFIVVCSEGGYKRVGGTVDDACGEALDKFGKLIGIDYPAGPKVEELSKMGNKYAFSFPVPKIKLGEYYVSFSGIKTYVSNLIKNLKPEEIEKIKADLASSFQEALFIQILIVIKRIIGDFKLERIAISGGVAANSRLRELLKENLEGKAQLFFPSKILCTDNAAMIAYAGLIKYRRAGEDPLNLPVVSRLLLG
jgi:N6-L-threonylcarbamoyladenine synthase